MHAGSKQGTAPGESQEVSTNVPILQMGKWSPKSCSYGPQSVYALPPRQAEMVSFPSLVMWDNHISRSK